MYPKKAYKETLLTTEPAKGVGQRHTNGGDAKILSRRLSADDAVKMQPSDLPSTSF
jgi:hypothetical protein